MKHLISSFFVIASLATYADVTQAFGMDSAVTGASRIAALDPVSTNSFEACEEFVEGVCGIIIN